jgi:hypothetical protein
MEPSGRASRTRSVISLSVSMFQSSSVQSTDLYDRIEAVTEADLVVEAGEVVKGIRAARFGQCSCLAGILEHLQSLAPWLFGRSTPPSKLAFRSLSPVTEHGRGVESALKDFGDPQEVGVSDRSISKRFSSAYGKTKVSLSSVGKDIEGTIYTSSWTFGGKDLDGEISRELEELGRVVEVLLVAAVESMSPSKVVHWTKIAVVALDDA